MKNFLLLIASFAVSIYSFSQPLTTSAEVTADYQNRITQTGGSISNNDLLAVKNFVNAAKVHLYWDKLIEIGMFDGNNLSASLVKLKYPNGVQDKIVNNGFLPADYVSNQGFQLDTIKSFNTKTNLNTLNLKGLFGFSMWLGNKGIGWIGSPNNTAPYSVLLGSNSSVIAYIGSPPNYVAVGGGIPSSTDAFYHVIKQSLDSAKVFVNGNQVGQTSTTLTSVTLRNADIEVFKGASSGGRGLFYCIDNGRLTDTEVGQFYMDVRQLMFDLGRIIAPPIISANGLYSATQNVTITEALTNSLMAGATIYYTTDGTTPTTASQVYKSPLTISTTTKVQAITVKNEKQSLPAEAWVAIVPEGFNTNKYYTAHVMVNLLAFTNDMDGWLNQMKAAGYNLIWAHLDDYSGNYVTTLKSLLDAAQRVGGIAIMPGVSWWVDPNSTSQMFHDTWNQPALFKIGGKRIYTGWDYQPNNQHKIDSILALQHITKDQYYLWVHSRYPYSYDSGITWVGEYADNGYVYWNGSSSAALSKNVDHLYQTRPQLDGLIDFAVDQGGDNKNIIKTNRLITQSSLEKGKFSMAGVSAFYSSVSFADFGFKGAAEIWDSLLALPVGSRPTAMSDITANDYAELSYFSPLVLPPIQGLSFIPPFSSGFTLSNNIRYPVTDHSGIQKFLRPWVEAFKNNQSSPIFSEDRIFAWYWLHPQDQQPSTTIPKIFNGYAQLNQQWWNTTVYATANINVGGGNQVDGMKYFFKDQMNKISMAVHLTAPAQLKINDSISELKQAGAAYFEIEMNTFRGTPNFSIIRNGIEIKKGAGLQPITNSAFPGGWNFLSTEILASGTNNYYRSNASGNWNNVTSWQSSTDSVVWINSTSLPSSIVNYITILNGHKITITDSATVDQLLIQNGGVLAIAHNASLTINDGPGDDIIIAPSGSLVIQSDSIGTGCISNSTGSVYGNVTVEQYISSSSNKTYRMLSPSVNTFNSIKPFIRDNWQEGQNNTSLTSNMNLTPHYGTHITGSATGANGFDATKAGSASLATYNPMSDSNWTSVANTNATNLEAKKGYRILITGDRGTDLRTNVPPPSTTLRATGAILSGTQTFTKPNGNRRTALIGNPYPCPIDWSNLYNDSTTANNKNFENYYIYWDPSVATSGGYITVTSEGIKSAPSNAATEIKSGQAFIITAKQGVLSPVLTVKETHKLVINNLKAFRILPKQQFFTTLYYSTPERRIMADAVNTVFDGDYSNSVNDQNAEDLENIEENISINQAGKMLSIEKRPLIISGDSILLNIQRLKAQNYEWQFDPTDFLKQDLQAYLDDEFLHTHIPISLISKTVIPFSVTSDPASNKNDRFKIIFAENEKIPINIDSVNTHIKTDGVRLDWVSKNEGNINNYEIEKSFEGSEFTKVGAVPRKIINSVINSYTWFDAYPNIGINYYRIKIIDDAGKIKYSSIVSSEFKGQSGNFVIYPNPMTGRYTTVQFNDVPKGTYNFKLINSNGQSIFEKVIHHVGGTVTQHILINIGLPVGAYDVQIIGNGVSFNKQILKK